MATLNTTYTFTNGNVAEAGQVNTNFNDIESWVSTNLVQVDGSVQAPTIAIADGAITSPKLAPPTLVTKSSSSTLVITDANCTLLCGAGITLTVPTSSIPFPVGTVITVVNYGGGTVTISQGSVTVNSSNGKTLRTRYSAASLIKLSDSEWLLTGDTVTP